MVTDGAMCNDLEEMNGLDTMGELGPTIRFDILVQRRVTPIICNLDILHLVLTYTLAFATCRAVVRKL